MPFQILLTARSNRDKQRDKKVVLNALMKHMEEESSQVKHTLKDKDSTFINIFRDCFVSKQNTNMRPVLSVHGFLILTVLFLVFLCLTRQTLVRQRQGRIDPAFSIYSDLAINDNRRHFCKKERLLLLHTPRVVRFYTNRVLVSIRLRNSYSVLKNHTNVRLSAFYSSASIASNSSSPKVNASNHHNRKYLC